MEPNPVRDVAVSSKDNFAKIIKTKTHFMPFVILTYSLGLPINYKLLQDSVLSNIDKKV